MTCRGGREGIFYSNVNYWREYLVFSVEMFNFVAGKAVKLLMLGRLQVRLGLLLLNCCIVQPES